MKINLSISIAAFFLLFVTSAFASQENNLSRKRLFHCRNFGEKEEVEELFIAQITKGTRTYYEVEVPYRQSNEIKTFTRKLNLIPKYEGRVLLYTTGNYRVKVDKVFPVEKKYKAFVRLPRFNVHSTEWRCKDY